MPLVNLFLCENGGNCLEMRKTLTKEEEITASLSSVFHANMLPDTFIWKGKVNGRNTNIIFFELLRDCFIGKEDKIRVIHNYTYIRLRQEVDGPCLSGKAIGDSLWTSTPGWEWQDYWERRLVPTQIEGKKPCISHSWSLETSPTTHAWKGFLGVKTGVMLTDAKLPIGLLGRLYWLRVTWTQKGGSWDIPDTDSEPGDSKRLAEDNLKKFPIKVIQTITQAWLRDSLNAADMSIHTYCTLFSLKKHLLHHFPSLWDFFFSPAKSKNQGLVTDHWSTG